MISRDERILRILYDSTKEIDLLDEADLDRLLASLARKPVKTHTRDHQDLDDIETWWKDRYPQP